MSVYLVKARGWRYDFEYKKRRYQKGYYRTKTEAKEAEAQAIVTSCPRCIASLRSVHEGLNVYDLTVAVAKSMDLETIVF